MADAVPDLLVLIVELFQRLYGFFKRYQIKSESRRRYHSHSYITIVIADGNPVHVGNCGAFDLTFSAIYWAEGVLDRSLHV